MQTRLFLKREMHSNLRVLRVSMSMQVVVELMCEQRLDLLSHWKRLRIMVFGILDILVFDADKLEV